jgi:hypothetical protein
MGTGAGTRKETKGRRQPITRCDPQFLLLKHPRTGRLDLKGDRYTTGVGQFFSNFNQIFGISSI